MEGTVGDLAGALGPLFENPDEMTAEVTRAYGAEMTLDLDLDEHARRRLEAAGRLTVTLLLRCVRDRRRLTDIELAALIASARTGLGTDMPHYAVITAWHAGVRAVRQRMLRAVRSSDMDALDRIRLGRELASVLLGLSSQVGGALAGYGHTSAAQPSSGADPAQRGALRLLTDGFGFGPQARRRAAEAGFVLGEHNVVVALDSVGEAKVETVVDQLVATTETALRNPYRLILTYGKGGTPVLVVPLSRPQEVAMVVEALDANLERPKGESGLIAGLGRVHEGADQLPASYAEAERVLELLRWHPTLGPVLTYERALPYMVLEGAPELSVDVLRGVLGPLLAHDADRGTELVRTLDVYLRAAGNVADAADALGVHRHTFYKRLGRIEGLTGRDVKTRDDRFLFEMAIKVLQLVHREHVAQTS
jgi:hypothetical protein